MTEDEYLKWSGKQLELDEDTDWEEETYLSPEQVEEVMDIVMSCLTIWFGTGTRH